MSHGATLTRAHFCAACLGVLLAAPGMLARAQAAVLTPPVYTHEAAFADAPLVLRGDVLSNDLQHGASLRVSQVVRGDVRVGAIYALQGSAGAAFLSDLPRDVTVFARGSDERTLRLWQGPTSGGMIVQEPELLDQIRRAHADPLAALGAAQPREQLAGAYYLSRSGLADKQRKPLTQVERTPMIEIAAWGLAQASATTNQAALDILHALGHPLQGLGIEYHPGFKMALKQDAATRLRAWSATRR